MNLIKSTLLSVLLLQLLIFLYIKVFHNQNPNIQTKIHIALTTQPIVKKEFSRKNYITTHKTTEAKTMQIEKKKKMTPSKIIKKYTKTYLTKKKPLKKVNDTNSKVEQYAKKFLGNKYVWGATGPKTFDCSGFTQKVYRQSAGVTIPRVSRDQAKVGKYIEYANLKKGDMVFFDTTKEHLGKVNHVGIYLSKGNFIHASSGGKRVMITNFTKKRFYKNRFLWGRRITQEQTTVATLTHKQNKEES